MKGVNPHEAKMQQIEREVAELARAEAEAEKEARKFQDQKAEEVRDLEFLWV